MRLIIFLSVGVILLSVIFGSETWALTQDSQKVLNNDHNFEQSGSTPTASQPYPTNNSTGEINAAQSPKTNVIPPTTSQPVYSASNLSTQSTNNPGNLKIETQPWVLALIILVIIAVAGVGVYKKRESSSNDRPPSMKQLDWLRNRKYGGPMPTSCREAHKIISDIQSAGYDNFERDDYYHDGN